MDDEPNVGYTGPTEPLHPSCNAIAQPVAKRTLLDRALKHSAAHSPLSPPERTNATGLAGL